MRAISYGNVIALLAVLANNTFDMLAKNYYSLDVVGQVQKEFMFS